MGWRGFLPRELLGMGWRGADTGAPWGDRSAGSLHTALSVHMILGMHTTLGVHRTLSVHMILGVHTPSSVRGHTACTGHSGARRGWDSTEKGPTLPL